MSAGDSGSAGRSNATGAPQAAQHQPESYMPPCTRSKRLLARKTLLLHDKSSEAPQTPILMCPESMRACSWGMNSSAEQHAPRHPDMRLLPNLCSPLHPFLGWPEGMLACSPVNSRALKPHPSRHHACQGGHALAVIAAVGVTRVGAADKAGHHHVLLILAVVATQGAATEDGLQVKAQQGSGAWIRLAQPHWVCSACLPSPSCCR